MSKRQKALIAMSGGVDSSVAALLAQRMGYDCTGVTMRLIPDDGLLRCAREDGEEVCNDEAVRSAERVAGALGMPHLVLDFRSEFDAKVIRPFVESYMKGSTPNPCIDCNICIKFGLLYEYAKDHGFDKLVTGHYVKIVSDGGDIRLARAVHKDKDQSYFLYRLSQDKLSGVLFPLGDLNKEEVRNLAKEAGLECAERSDSQDICFIPEEGHAAFIEGYLGGSLGEGAFVDTSGKVLGRHGGISRYTIGQRKGLGIALGRPVFVKEIRPGTNEIVLSDEEDIFVSKIELEDVMLYTDELTRSQVMIRYRAEPVWAEINDINIEAEGNMQVVFDKPVRAPAKGQSAVLYSGDIVIGGGRIV